MATHRRSLAAAGLGCYAMTEARGVESGSSRSKRLDPKEWANRDMLTPDHKKLYEAAQLGHLEDCKRLLAKGVNPEVKDGCGQTALYYAAWKGHADCVELLADRMKTVDTTDKYVNTPLHYAAACGHIAAAEMLLHKGANVNALDKAGKAPLDYAKQHKQHAMIQYLKPLTKEMVLNGMHVVGDGGGRSGDGLDGTRGY